MRLLEPGVQDSLSRADRADARARRRAAAPTSFRLIDKDEVKEYQYTREGEAMLDTPLGKLDTVIYTQPAHRLEPPHAPVDRPEPRLSPRARRADARKGKREFTTADPHASSAR